MNVQIKYAKNNAQPVCYDADSQPAFPYLKKYRILVWGTVFCFFLMFFCTIYICMKGGTADIMNMFINIVCVAWPGCYILAMVDVLVLRKKYPDFPRLFKVPAVPVTFAIGIIGSLYATYTISDYIAITPIWIAVVIVFISSFWVMR